MNHITAQRNPNPYQNVNWDTVSYVTGCTHMHCTTPEVLQKYINEGLEFATLSNYYPSTPWYPLKNIRTNTFRLKQPAYIRNGKIVREELDIRKTVASWSEEQAAKLPAEEGELIAPELPPDFLEAPAAEHHWFSDYSVYLHICAPGSKLTSGHFDNQYQFGLSEHGYDLGCPLPWRKGFDEIFSELMIPDGGGIVIAHPHWSHMPLAFLNELLDYDPRVLGIEVYNYNSSLYHSENSEVEWDHILATGRQCFGFFVQDHPMQEWRGKCILLPEERTAESCLRAYRQGRFYGAIFGNGLRFEHISFDGSVIRAKCNQKVSYQITSAQGVVEDFYTTEIEFPVKEEDKKNHVFMRLTARDPKTTEKLYAQPFMLI
ncbi:MAG: hypothetical protein J6W81_03615 [Lentisphaeria bacterium]|nr:hypothetical protein [Lentisphaeria bacterium]